MGSIFIVFGLVIVSVTSTEADNHYFDDDTVDFQFQELSPERYYDNIEDIQEVYDTLKSVVIRGCVTFLVILALLVVVTVAIQCCFSCLCPGCLCHHDRRPVSVPGMNNGQPTVIVLRSPQVYGHLQENSSRLQVPPYWQQPEYMYHSAPKPPEYQPVPTDETSGEIHLKEGPCSSRTVQV